YGADAGVMISASHNPFEYNGIKIFNGEGFKLADAIEEEIEYLLDSRSEIVMKYGDELGKVTVSKTAVSDYIDHILMTVDTEMTGIKVALDCACGSASVTAKELFTRLGAEVVVKSNTYGGTDINDGCGSTHMESLQKLVVEEGCDIGLAFDGDADRCLAVDENGCLIDGDKMIAIFAKELKSKNELKNDTAVVTVMSNMGFFKFAKENGINTSITAVGDRYVLEEMLKEGYGIGGEQSGHIIFLQHATTGDGQLSGAQLLQVMAHTGKKASELASVMQVFPQVLKNLKVPNDQKGVVSHPEVQRVIKEFEEQLGDTGRILVRASGTEPLVRVMLEGENLDVISDIADKIVDVIKENM
ncbi:MAG: phosphoglucosamine mutase, partial [Oscillospiraceae bacterium]|nr:phosphoglucosamine mutase [Oscillospiraceae bacterium]